MVLEEGQKYYCCLWPTVSLEKVLWELAPQPMPLVPLNKRGKEMTWDEKQQQDPNVSQGYGAQWTSTYIPTRFWHLSEEKAWGARSGRFAQRIIFMAFWTEIWKLQVPLCHFFLKHMITPDKKDLEAKFWGWEVVCPLWVGRNFSDGGKGGHRSGTGSWYFGDPPSYFSLDLLFTASQTTQTQGLPKRKCPTWCLFEEVCLRNPDSWERLRAEAGGINKYQEVLGAKTDKLYFCTLRRLWEADFIPVFGSSWSKTRAKARKYKIFGKKEESISAA